MIVLDLGAGDATKNDAEYVKRIIDSIPYHKDIVLKFQLFKDIPGLTPLSKDVFVKAWVYGRRLGLPVTASVFDSQSMRELTALEVPFVKIACNPEWYPLIEEVPKGIPVLVSVDSHLQMVNVATDHMDKPCFYMMCIPEYPADTSDYTLNFSEALLKKGISDHTTDLELFMTYRPKIWERHYCIDPIGPDHVHSIGPQELEDILWTTATV